MMRKCAWPAVPAMSVFRPRGQARPGGGRRSYGFALCRLVTACLLISCSGESEDARLTRATRDAPIVPLDSGTVRIVSGSDTAALSVEIAETAEQTRIGLMERESMPTEEGMIFLFPETRDSTAGFWMYRTRIPLDIAYLDADGRIVALREMEPCLSDYVAACQEYAKGYAPGVPYRAALEVNHGYFSSRGIELGDRLTLRRPGGGWPDAAAPPQGATAD